MLGAGWFEVLMRATDGYPKRSGGAPTADAEAGMTGVFDDLRAEADDSLVGVVGRMELRGVEWEARAFSAVTRMPGQPQAVSISGGTQPLWDWGFVGGSGRGWERGLCRGGGRGGVEMGWRDEFLEGMAGGTGSAVVQSRLVRSLGIYCE